MKTLSINSIWRPESYSMRNFILFRNIHKRFFRLKFTFFQYWKNYRSHLKLTNGNQFFKKKKCFISFSGHGCRQSYVSFLFSLKNKDNVPPFKTPVYRNHRYAIVSSSSCGPTFGGGHDLFISNDSHTNQHSYTDFGHTYQPPEGYVHGTPQTKSLLAGSYEFTPTEIEVFF